MIIELQKYIQNLKKNNMIMRYKIIKNDWVGGIFSKTSQTFE